MAHTVIGDGAFSRIRKRWLMSDFGLDTLVESWQGAKSAKATFEATLTKWQANADDGNMFLASWDDDDDPVKPTFELRYVGCRAGDVASKTHENNSSAVQTANYNDDGTTVDLTYISYSTIKNTITRERPTTSIGATVPADALGVRYERETSGLVIISGSPEERLAYVIENYFEQQLVTVPQTNEVVPGQYYVNSEVTTNMLFAD